MSDVKFLSHRSSITNGKPLVSKDPTEDVDQKDHTHTHTSHTQRLYAQKCRQRDTRE